MTPVPVRRLMVAAFLVLSPALAQAQRTSVEQAQRLLRSRPDLVAQLRQRIITSGMTPDQVRARLRAEGYPENILDAYLPGGTTADSIPSGDVFRAVRALGIADSTDVAALELMMDDSTRALRSPADTLALVSDSARIRVNADSARRISNEIFGLSLFRRTTSQFDANLSGPVDENYRLGPGDQLVLILTGDVESARTLDVTREGFIVIPQVGQLSVANLTLGQLNDLLYDRLGRVYSGVSRGPDARTRFSVNVAKLRSNQVFVVGDVARPASYRISSAGTALSALYAAGGPTPNGTLRAIEVRRGGRVVQTLDVYDYLLRGDVSHDPRLETGDLVFVGVHGRRVAISGEVIRPAQYELTANETLADLLRMAGGFSPTASLSRIQIERIAPPSSREGEGHERVLVDVTSPTLGRGAVPAIALESGDVIHVFRIADRVRDRIVVLGNVWQEGAQGFVPGMMLSEALRGAGGTKSDTYLGQVLISRLRADSTRAQLRAVLRDTTGAAVTDIALQEDDEIQVFSLSSFRPERYVAISGAVRANGRYPYRDGMTMRDLILMAGGLQQSAYLQEAEIARLPADRSNGATAVTFRVPLDSTYLFERDAVGRYLGPPGLPAPASQAPEQRLEPYDNVLVLPQPDFQLHRTVQIGGEVKFPGEYSLRTKGERLSDVLVRAGGLTTEAYPEGIQFFRRGGELGRIGIDLPRVLRDPRERDNLILENGDSVFLPRYSPVVNVLGAVNAPVAVAFVPGKDLDYYIRRAGGANRRADAKRAFVRQSNGSVESRERHFLFFMSTPTPQPGSLVSVPERDPNDKRDYTAIATSIAQVVVSLVAIVAIARR
ncbi:MAG: SLBB domain-containing protein [Gemmatimonadaceae bacterium]